MPPTNCIIEFNNPNGKFFSGQELSGNIRIVNDIVETIRGISVTVVGKTAVDWTESERRNSISCKAEEMFLSSCTYVVGSEGGSSLTLAPGIYDYQFKKLLPIDLPTTFDDEDGSIFYYVVVIINRVRLCNEGFKKRFEVIHALDLNIDPKYREPQIISESKQFHCWSCTSGNVEVQLALPGIGFVPGQIVNFTIVVNNSSNKDIDNVTAYILQEVQFTSASPNDKVKHTKEKILNKEIGWIWKSTKKIFEDNITIPQIPPSTIDTLSRCIRIEYYFVVVAETGCCSTDIKLFTKIIIGTVPIYNYPTAPNIPITTQPTITQNTPLLPAILEKNIARCYSTFD